MKYAAAQLLAGCILQNQLNGKVVIANTVEVYGRKRSVDIHCEPFGTKKQSTIPTSLPPSVVLRYDNVYPVTLNSQLTYCRNPTVRNFDGCTSVGDQQETDKEGFQSGLREELEYQEAPGEESIA
ncbi:hypothetical protein G6F58_010156 [Rhizopus delemar]|nr:hypothetical protein G6F58_010156 [Rhizopus delemar]